MEKILLSGDVGGQFPLLLKQVRSVLSTQGPFLCMLCTGSFFDGESCVVSPCKSLEEALVELSRENQDFLTGIEGYQLPIPVYFVDNSNSRIGLFLRQFHPDGLQLCQNLIYLGVAGTRFIGPLRIAYATGMIGCDSANVEEQERVVSLVEKSFNQTRGGGVVDILLTDYWPCGLTNDLSTDSIIELKKLLEASIGGGRNMICSQAVSRIAVTVEARYHIATKGGVFYPRTFFRLPRSQFLSRFIGLGSLPAYKKSKGDKKFNFMHCLKLTPASTLPPDKLKDEDPSIKSSPFLPHQRCRCIRKELALYSPEGVPSSGESSPSRKRVIDNTAMTNLRRRFSAGSSPVSEPYKESEKRSADSNVPESFSPQGEISSTPSNKKLRLSDSIHRLAHVINTNHPERIVYIDKNPSSHLRSNASLPELSSEPPSWSPQTLITSQSQQDRSPPQERNSDQITPNETVFIGNLPYTVDEGSLTQLLQSYGPIAHFRMPRSNNGNSTGKAWVTFEDITSARKAVEASGSIVSGNRAIRMAFARQNDHNDGGSSRNKEPHTPPIDIRPHTDCWFCLSGPNAQQNLVVAVGTSVYVAVAKGALTASHVLIVPVKHFPNILSTPFEIAEEFILYIQALRRCYAAEGLSTIVFERYYPMKTAKVMHMQIQVVPVPKEIGKKSASKILEYAESCGVTMTKLNPVNSSLNVLREVIPNPLEYSYFYMETESEESTEVERYFFTDNGTRRFHANFGREAVARLLGQPERSDWKKCVLLPEEEEESAILIRKSFANFQPGEPVCSQW
eukprot:GHVP01063475.1.p1 GENE.GHVP01063475.1~~GHVP01063475.1.p1  ORF type:complete len:791 (+),score=122.79 GHVP01063475.1:52-2424(+)